MNGVGFHIPGMFDKVLDIHKCWLQDDISNRIRLAIKDYCLTHEGYPFFDLRNQEGFIRTLMIRTASTGDLMVVVVFFHEDKERREALLSYVAEQFPEITSLQYVINGKCNDSAFNQIENTLFYAGDMKDILTQDFINEHGRPDVIITDPPRAGMHDDVIKTILFARPQRIVYVSCNPATQARDLSLLDGAYAVKKVQPVDMFPHTHHVENVVLLELRTDTNQA